MISETKVCTCKGTHTIECVVDQFKNEKCTLGWAAEAAGIDIEVLKKELLKRGIHPYELTEEQYKRSLEVIDRIT